ncbi:MAG: exo-alpha-sialidase [Chitinophagaceae bacterium]|nr:MAG: exo-alpha-sialidase [Chitinophagaceae bacterium]
MYKSAFILSGITIMSLVQSFIYLPVQNRIERNSIAIKGKAPSVIAEGKNIHMSYASGDSILFCFSSDKGKSFSTPVLVAVLPQLSLGGGRGPQIVSSRGQLIIAAADSKGNIYTYIKKKNAIGWEKGGRINDVSEVAKEAFVSLASDNNGDVYAVWLDLRGDKKNKIVGASSRDAGKTWSKNRVIYKSPDGTVCECCKPSVAMKNKLVVIMFRNWLKGNRDLYLTQSNDGGINFDKAQKLGEVSWKLNGCPMDGGGIVINNDNTINTVWRRQGNIYSCEAGKKEEVIAMGKQCVIAGSNGNGFIAFVNEGKVYCIKPDGTRVESGSGSYPQLVVTGVTTAFYTWEQEGKIYYATLNK